MPPISFTIKLRVPRLAVFGAVGIAGIPNTPRVPCFDPQGKAGTANVGTPECLQISDTIRSGAV